MKFTLVISAIAALLQPAVAADDSIQAGALYNIPSTSNDNITSISGTFRVPDLSIPLTGPTANQKAIYAFSIWIGIGGYHGYGLTSACPANSGVLRAGIDVYYDGYSSRTMMPFAWYQFGTASEVSAFAYAGFNLAAGDLIRVSVSAESGNVTAIIENYGKVDTVVGNTPIQREPPTYGIQENVANTLCRTEAAWMVQSHMTETEPATPVIMPNFTDVAFAEMSLNRDSGPASEAVTAAKTVNINLPEQGGQLTECSAVNAAEFRCSRAFSG